MKTVYLHKQIWGGGGGGGGGGGIIRSLLTRFLADCRWIILQELELSENLTIAPLQCFACSKARVSQDNEW